MHPQAPAPPVAARPAAHLTDTRAVPRPPPAAPAPQRALRLHASTFGSANSVAVKAGTLRFDCAHSYTLGAGAMLGPLAGVPVPRFDFTGSLASFVTPPAAHSHLVGPILQVGWSWLGPATRASQGLQTRLLGLQAGLRACSAIDYDSEGLVLLVCSEFNVGWLNLRTTDAQGKVTQSKDLGFGSAGLGLDLQYNLGGLLHADLRLGGTLQPGTVSAERPDGSRIFKSSPFGGYATLGLGLHFQ